MTTTTQSRTLYTKGDPFEVPISQIEKSINISPRSKRITNAQILRMARRPASEFDPILVWSRSGGSYVIVDGYHRYVVYQMQGATTIKVKLVYGELTNYDRLHINEPNYIPMFVLLAAYRENVDHGQHLLERERRSFVRHMVSAGITDIATLTRESELHPDMVVWLATHGETPKTEESEDDEYHRKTVGFFHYLGRYMRYLESVGIDTENAHNSTLLVSDMIDILSSLPARKLQDVVRALDILGRLVSDLIDRKQKGEDGE